MRGLTPHAARGRMLDLGEVLQISRVQRGGSDSGVDDRSDGWAVRSRRAISGAWARHRRPEL